MVRLVCAAGDLLVTQAEVIGLAPAHDVHFGGDGSALVSFNEADLPVFILDEHMQPAPLDRGFRFCAGLRSVGGVHFALACETVDLLPGEELELQPLPRCMPTAATPFDSLAIHGDRAGLRLDLDALWRHLERASG